MFKKLFVSIIFTIVFFNFAFAQLTLIIDSVPRFYAPPGDHIYVAGTFNNWNPGDENYKLNKNFNGTYNININGAGLIEYKFTTGSWETNETKLNGEQLPNRRYTYTGKLDTIHIKIEKWAEEIKSTRTANVFILDSNMFMPQLNRSRRIWMYLPNDYATSNRNYPVMYLQDGQNIFDAATSFSGEWFVDDSLHAMELKGDPGMIVVGIENGGKFRIDEYVPYNNPKYGGGQGNALADFIVNTLKPRIDSTFRTKSDRLNTAIGGSSLAAYFALYTGIKFQNVFSKIAALSPAYWFDDSLFTYVINTRVNQPMRIYQVCSQNEGGSVVYDMNRMQDTLIKAGMLPGQLQCVTRDYGSHSESFWRLEFGTGYRWLFSNTPGTIVENLAEAKEVTLNPNPANTFVKIGFDFTPNTFSSMHIFDARGRELPFDSVSTKISDNQIIINTAKYKPGTYSVWLIDSKDKLFVRKFKKR